MPFGQKIDDLLDTLSSGTSEEVETALDTYSMRDIVGVLAKRLLDAEVVDGSSSPVNWARIALADPGTELTVASPNHQFTAAEITIVDQEGSDFSVDTVAFSGVIRSAAGGRFQVATYLANPDNATLDGASDLERYLLFAAVVGDNGGPLANFGLDAMVPILPSPRNNRFAAASCGASSMGYTAAGGLAASSIKVELVGGIGTDSVPLSAGFGFDNFIVYQV